MNFHCHVFLELQRSKGTKKVKTIKKQNKSFVRDFQNGSQKALHYTMKSSKNHETALVSRAYCYCQKQWTNLTSPHSQSVHPGCRRTGPRCYGKLPSPLHTWLSQLQKQVWYSDITGFSHCVTLTSLHTYLHVRPTKKSVMKLWAVAPHSAQFTLAIGFVSLAKEGLFKLELLFKCWEQVRVILSAKGGREGRRERRNRGKVKCTVLY